MLEQADIEAIKTLLAPIVERLDNLEIGQQKLTKRMGSLEEESRQTRVLIESDVRRDIQIIAEQHGDIIERLDKINQIDDLKDRVRNLERVVTAHSADLRELKKAQ